MFDEETEDGGCFASEDCCAFGSSSISEPNEVEVEALLDSELLRLFLVVAAVVGLLLRFVTGLRLNGFAVAAAAVTIFLTGILG